MPAMHVMDFAKKQLEKYGWAEGEGLGKNGDGRAQPIRVKIKRDYGGVGLQPGEEAVGQWWNKMFDSAVRNITVTADKEDVVVQHNPGSGEEDLLSAVNRRYRHSLTYRDFVKSTGVGVAPQQPSFPDISSTRPRQDTTMVSDMDLWKACSGRTAHKAARHGMKLSGKLRRIEEQEAQHSVTKDLLFHVAKASRDHVTPDRLRDVTEDVRGGLQCVTEHHVTKDILDLVTEEAEEPHKGHVIEDTQHHVSKDRLCCVTGEAKRCGQSLLIETEGSRKAKKHKRWKAGVKKQ